VSEPNGSVPRVEFTNPQVNLYAHDIEGSLRFYRDTLGFMEAFRVPEEGVPEHVELKLGPFKLGVATSDALIRHHGIQTGLGPPRAEIVLFTDDVDGAYGWTTSRGAPSLSAPHDFGGYVYSARVADPDGNPVGFTTRLPVKMTPHAGQRPAFKNHLFNIYTSNMEKSLRFYHELLATTETFRGPKLGSPDHVEMELGPLNLAVSTLEALKRDFGLSGGGGPPRCEVVLWVRDVDTALSWLNAQGAPTLSPSHDFAGTLRGAWVADPDGNPVQLVARLASR
jgi:catechol 2,3-dioxygenase-like lactoylglutathione lyase family enzyme